MKALFEQAGIKVQKEQEFSTLKSVIDRALSSAQVEKFLKKFESKKLHIRKFEKALDAKIFDSVDETFAKSGQSAKQLYSSLPVTDQGQIREFYLTRIEEVDSALRHKFQKVYSYY